MLFPASWPREPQELLLFSQLASASLHQPGAESLWQISGGAGQEGPANHWCCVEACVRCGKGGLVISETPTLLGQAAGGQEGAPGSHQASAPWNGVSLHRDPSALLCLLWAGFSSALVKLFKVFLFQTIVFARASFSVWGRVGKSSYSCNLGSYVCVLKSQFPCHLCL